MNYIRSFSSLRDFIRDGLKALAWQNNLQDAVSRLSITAFRYDSEAHTITNVQIADTAVGNREI